MTNGKECKECQCWKPIDQFNKAALARDGHTGVCKQCRRDKLDRQRRPSALNLLPSQERDGLYVQLLMKHGYSSAAFYERMKARGFKPEQAVQLAEAAYSNNDVYGRLRRQMHIKFRVR